MCSTAIMAHGVVDPATGVFTGVQSCISLGPFRESYHVVFTINPSDPRKRHLLSRIPLPHGRKPSYMHSMGFSKNFVVLIAQPMHLSLEKTMTGSQMADGLMYIGNGTIFQVVNRSDGSYRNYPFPSFLFAHVLNTWEEDGDVVLDITWYQADEQLGFL